MLLPEASQCEDFVLLYKRTPCLALASPA